MDLDKDLEREGVGETRQGQKQNKKRVSREEALTMLSKDIGFSPLHINRIDVNSLSLFKDLAYNEFGGDYGITIKFLLESFLVNQHIRYLDVRLHDVEEQLKALTESLSIGEDGDGDDAKGDGVGDDKTPVSLTGKKISTW